MLSKREKPQIILSGGDRARDNTKNDLEVKQASV